MPEVCKICLNALRKHANGHELVGLTFVWSKNTV